jgi:RNase P subunit RPR2
MTNSIRLTTTCLRNWHVSTHESGVVMPARTITAAILPVLKPSRIRVNETYDTWLCRRCSKPIAVAARAPLSDPADTPDGVVQIRCPHCGELAQYAVRARRVRQYLGADQYVLT